MSEDERQNADAVQALQHRICTSALKMGGKGELSWSKPEQSRRVNIFIHRVIQDG